MWLTTRTLNTYTDVPKRGRCSDSHIGLDVARVLKGACGSDVIVYHRNAYAQKL